MFQSKCALLTAGLTYNDFDFSLTAFAHRRKFKYCSLNHFRLLRGFFCYSSSVIYLLLTAHRIRQPILKLCKFIGVISRNHNSFEKLEQVLQVLFVYLVLFFSSDWIKNSRKFRIRLNLFAHKHKFEYS